MVCLGLGDLDRAMDYLEEAHENGSNVMTILDVDPLLDPLETNQRFLRLKSRVREGRIR